MDISVINSNDVKGLTNYIGDDILIISVKYSDDLYYVQMSSEDETFRAFSNSRKAAISNNIRAIQKVHS